MGLIDSLFNIISYSPSGKPAAAKPKTPQEKLDECQVKFDPKTEEKDYHLCLIDTNLEIHRDFLREMREKESANVRKGFQFIDDRTAFSADPAAATQEYVYSVFRDTIRQSENWLMKDAAKRAYDLHWMLQRYSDDDLGYTERAIQYLEAALLNVNQGVSFDTHRWFYPPQVSFLEHPWQATVEFFASIPKAVDEQIVHSPTIFHTEAYYEVKLMLIQILNIDHPKQAEAEIKLLETELHDYRKVNAHGSNFDSAEGYLNRLNMLRAMAGLFRPDLDSNINNGPMNYARQSQAWAGVKYQSSLFTLWLDGLNKRDLKYDQLLATGLIAKLQFNRGEYREALNNYQWLLDQPEAIRKYGGFLDIGLDAFFNIVLIGLATSPDLKTAEEFINNNLPLEKIDQDPKYHDLREALGLLVRNRGFLNSLSQFTHVGYIDPEEVIGKWALELGRPAWAPLDDRSIMSDLKFSQFPSKLGLIMRLIDHVELPAMLRREIWRNYQLRAPEAGEKP